MAETTVSSELLSLTGEYAVASRLARLGHYAQLTFGNRKRTDILVDAADGTLFRVEVKAKQAREWLRVQPPRAGDFLVLVDFQGKGANEPPAFYILNHTDWIELINDHRQRHPQMEVDEDYAVRWPDGWRGLNLKAEWVQQHCDRWHKIAGPHTADERVKGK